MHDGSLGASPESVLLVAEHRRGHGTGHLRRCARLAEAFARPPDWLLPSAPGPELYTRAESLSLLGPGPWQDGVRWLDSPGGPYDLIIVDRREMSLEELQNLPSRGIVVGIDAAGELRSYASYLVDTLPTPPGFTPPNIADTAFLPLPEESSRSVRREWPERCGRILVAFGGEERDELTLAAGRILREGARNHPPPVPDLLLHRHDDRSSSGISLARQFGVLRPRPDLAECLASYDLVVTHYGVLAWEALWARVPVILCNPTDYHHRLAVSAGFFSCRQAEELGDALESFAHIRAASQTLRPARRRDLAAFLQNLRPPERVGSPSGNPSGGPRYQPAVERFPDRTYFLNRPDGLVYLQRFVPSTIRYDHDYFHREYLEQYGKTYLEDFPAIARHGRGRISRILGLLKRSNSRLSARPRLLDIGCAYGPFLKVASQAGCTVLGLEINKEAVRYVQDELGLEAREGDLARLRSLVFQERFDIVTLWYVIEHVVYLDELLADIAAILKPGGVLAFSTPHGRGVSARRCRRSFLQKSPPDHYTVWDGYSARRVLGAHGFRVRKLHCTGHHPERFFSRPVRSGSLQERIVLPLVRIWSILARRGDTFEVYAERL